MRFIDDILNSITMYRLVLYYLLVLIAVAVVLSFFGFITYSPLSIIASTLVLIIFAWATNTIFAKVFDAYTNLESVYISALILALIITPMRSVSDVSFLGWAAVWSMASKYILALNKKHIFNPAAFAVFLTALTLNQSASWWVGNLSMLPFVLIGGLLVVRKLGRVDLVLSFLVVGLATIIGFSFQRGTMPLAALQKSLVESPILFFAFIMLTEPLTTPPTRKLRIIYGAITGFLFSPQVHIAFFYTTPEIALLIGNIFAWIVSPKQKLMLALKEKVQIATDVYDFVFALDKKFAFAPGQYMEWTLGHTSPDTRGNRRYLTIASSPTENNLRIGVKFPAKDASMFKQSLLHLKDGSKILAGQLAGDFTLPENPNDKLIFIAGGIGITPFRSMIKYLLDTNERRNIVVFFANRKAEDIVYKNILDEAQRKLGIRTIYTLTDKKSVPKNWNGNIGYITPEMIKKEVPDYHERTFYLSGPRSMVENFEDALSKMGLSPTQIKTDFFPGFA